MMANATSLIWGCSIDVQQSESTEAMVSHLAVYCRGTKSTLVGALAI
jgi:hypothetical protein